MLDNETFKKQKTGYCPELFIGTPADKYLKQYQIETDTDPLLVIDIVQNQIKRCISLVSH